MGPEYAELHCHSWFSFKEGASSPDDLVATALSLGYKALALTDHDSLAGAMEFAQTARALGMKSIIGAEITLIEGHHLTALASNHEGYSNLCRLLSLSHVLAEERTEPVLDRRLLREHSEGLVILSGCPKGEVPDLASKGKVDEAFKVASEYKEWFGDRYYIELQQSLMKGDAQRNRRLIELARMLGAGVVATNNAHYHHRSHANLHDALVAIKNNKSLEEAQHSLRGNREFYLKSPQEMAALFTECPEAISNTLAIAKHCSFDLAKELQYKFPDYETPQGHTPFTYIQKLCHEAARRRYGSVTAAVEARLNEEFRLIKKHGLAGFLLHYYDIALMAKEVMVRLGLSDPEIPIEERPPGKGRGSSVALLVGYLLGLSHIDPLHYNLSLERFLPEDRMALALDIDLDFPRNIREELILEVHKRWGWEGAALTGMRSTYQIKGAIRDLGKVLGLPREQVDQLAKRVNHASAKDLEGAMKGLPEYREKTKDHGWRQLLELARQIDGAPKYIAQHPGGMVFSSRPLTDFVPVQKGAIDGRYVLQWDKNDIEDAGFVKIDFLALGALSQAQDILQMVEKRTGKYIDLSRIDFEDMNVYRMLWKADTIGIFQVESAAQMQTITRLKPQNLVDMAHEVACVRPGVGANDGVRTYLRRRLKQETVTFDHPLEKRALGRTYGAVIYQDQLNELAMYVGGFSPDEADQLRRAFSRKNNDTVLQAYWRKFLKGAIAKGVSSEAAERIFKKINGHYMFPEAHAYAFGVTAYQMSWLKYYYPVEFYVALMNQQPMGFWGLDTIKEDAKKHGISFLNPDMNLSIDKYTIEDQVIRMGLLSVRNVGQASAAVILEERKRAGPFVSLGDFMVRTKLLRAEIESLVKAGTLDSLGKDRRSLLWEVGLRYKPVGKQVPLALPSDQDMVPLAPLDEWERMTLEYGTMNLYPGGHAMEMLRPYLPTGVLTSDQVASRKEGAVVKVAGVVARPLQHPLSTAYFMTLEDEHGQIALAIWPDVYERFKGILMEPLLMVEGVVSRKDGTLMVEMTNAAVPRIRRGPKGQMVEASSFLKLPRPMFR